MLARKWRPQTFADLVGQEHVTQTLRNAIAQGRIAHAFLFTGARGVGKTTIARVLAKALNCMQAPGPTPDPCGRCVACEEIARSSDLDVREIDGATYTQVEKVRELQEWLPYMPARDRFKVVIIDEVHMLSTSAFNALLKTLEEPPPHVKFIFATTEVHKVLPTILSRVQRYDFKLIPTQKIRERIAYILDREGIEYDAGAIGLVAREAAGSMRDALSLLDQVVAHAAGKKLVGEEVSRLLGVADRKVLYDLARAVIAGDAKTALQCLHSVSCEGYDLLAFARDFLSTLRDLVVARIVPEPTDLLDLADEERQDVIAIARSTDVVDLERLFAAWSRASDDAARAREPRWVLEMALVRLAHRPPLVPIDDLIARLTELEKKLGAGEGRTPSPAGEGSRSARSVTATAGNERRWLGSATGTIAQAEGAHPARVEDSANTERTRAARTEENANTERTRAAVTENVTSANGPVGSMTRANGAGAAQGENVPTSLAKAVQVMEVPVVSSAPLAVTRPSAPAAGTVVDTSGAEAALDAWSRVVAAMDNGPVAVLESAVPLEVNGERIRIAYEAGSFYARKAVGSEVQALIVSAAQRVFGEKPAVEIVLGRFEGEPPTLTARKAAARAADRARREAALRDHPVVKSFLEHVGGEIQTVKVEEKEP